MGCFEGRCKLEPFVRKIGFFQIFCGIVSMLFGIFDMYLCLQVYNQQLAVCGKLNEDGTTSYPCKGWEYSRLIGSIGTPIWAGKFFIATGGFAVRLLLHDNCKAALKTNEIKVTIFRTLSLIGAIAVAPVLLSVTTMEVVTSPAGQGFKDSGFPVLKWIIPSVASFIGFMHWVLALLSVIVVWCKKNCSCFAVEEYNDAMDPEQEKQMELLLLQTSRKRACLSKSDNIHMNNETSVKKYKRHSSSSMRRKSIKKDSFSSFYREFEPTDKELTDSYRQQNCRYTKRHHSHRRESTKYETKEYDSPNERESRRGSRSRDSTATYENAEFHSRKGSRSSYKRRQSKADSNVQGNIEKKLDRINSKQSINSQDSNSKFEVRRNSGFTAGSFDMGRSSRRIPASRTRRVSEVVQSHTGSRNERTEHRSYKRNEVVPEILGHSSNSQSYAW